MKKLGIGFLVLIVLATNIAAAPVRVPTGTLTRIDALSTPVKGGALTFTWTLSIKDNAKWRLFVTSYFYDSITGFEYYHQMDCIDKQNCYTLDVYNSTEFGAAHPETYRLYLLPWYLEKYPCEPDHKDWCDQPSTGMVRILTKYWIRNENTGAEYTLDTVTTMVSR